MRYWVQILPFFVVAWLARWMCMRCRHGRITYAVVTFGKRVTLIEVERDEVTA